MRHVGNAVPPLLARAIRDCIAENLRSTISCATPRSTNTEAPVASIHGSAVLLRSRIMRSVPARNTSIELKLRKLLWAAGIRGYRLHDARVPGHPDFVFSIKRVAISVDGCFWHGCEKCYRAPQSNEKYWQMKVARNRERDVRVNDRCRDQGWRVLRVWEH